MKGAKVATQTVKVQAVTSWDCPWYRQESDFIASIHPKVLWWIAQTQMLERIALMKLLFSRGSESGAYKDYPFFQRHLTEQGAGVDSHFTKMVLLLVERMKLIELCPDSPVLLGTAMGDADDWRVYHDHERNCFGSCAAQVKHLEVITEQLHAFDLYELI